eukprot:c2667_g1_i1 orf=1-180(-)
MSSHEALKQISQGQALGQQQKSTARILLMPTIPTGIRYLRKFYTEKGDVPGHHHTHTHTH